MSATLLDTQALLWLLNGDAKLSTNAASRIGAPAAELFLSYASVWEIVIKYSNGKLELPSPPETFLGVQLTLNRIRLLPISIASIFHTGSLPKHHKDPFDRLIAAQCLRHDLTLISSDTIFDEYGVRREW